MSIKIKEKKTLVEIKVSEYIEMLNNIKKKKKNIDKYVGIYSYNKTTKGKSAKDIVKNLISDLY